MIIVIGLTTIDDLITLSIIGEWLRIHRNRPDLEERIDLSDYSIYDMALYPEKGDAIDAITDEVELVISLHIYGIDQIPKPNPPEITGTYLYNRENGFLLKECMERNIPLICWGDQPWLGVQRKTQLHKNAIWIYEPNIG